jgi:dTDP-4-amino-4,6-dideoxygalactose transaminase
MAKLAIKGGKKAYTQKLPQWPAFDQKEEKALLEALKKTDWGGYPPPNTITKRFCDKFAKKHDSKFCFTNASGTAALQLACKALDIGWGDEVIVPALTFTATASCALFVDALPIFVDVSPDTLCLDPAAIEFAISSRTKAIIPVHLGAHAADMDAIMRIAKKRKLYVIEDCAHAHGLEYKGKSAGSFGHINCFSFQSSKVMTAGEGGACTMSEQSLYDKVVVLTNAGRKGPREGTKLDTLGWALRLTEFQAAILEVGLERLFKVQIPAKQKNYKIFQKRISQIPGLRTLPDDKNITRKSGYGFIVMYDENYFGVKRDKVVEAICAEGVPAFGAFYEPVYNAGIFPLAEDGSPRTMRQMRGKIDYRKFQGMCPVSERAAYHETIWVLHRMLLGTKEQTGQLCDAFEKVIKNIDELRK